jgi:dihydroorotase
MNAHCHLRDNEVADQELLPVVAPIQAANFDWCVGMPNTTKPILTGEDAQRYLERINHHAPNLGVIPVNYLTVDTTRQMVQEAAQAGVKAYKLYVGGTTMNSAHGVPITRLAELDDVLDEMDGQGLRLCIHAEDPRESSFRARESVFLPLFRRLVERHPCLLIVFEHISSADAIEVCRHYPNVWMGVTPHHLWLTEDDALGIADYLCMPVIKTPRDREALRTLFASGHPRVLIGLDDAPHTIARKRNLLPGQKPPSGIWCAEAGLSVYAAVLEERNALQHLPDLVWGNAARLYDLPPPSRPVHFVRKPVTIRVEEDPSRPQPFLAGQTLDWSIEP